MVEVQAQRQKQGRSVRSLAAVATLMLLTASPALAEEEGQAAYQYGPPPAWGRYRELAEASVRTLLVDPDSARFTWTQGYRRGGFHPTVLRPVFGYAACGYVNSRNRMGGFQGDISFVVVIDADTVKYTEVDDRDDNGFIANNCAAMRRKGGFLPLPKEAAGSAGPNSGGFDFSLTTVPDGAYVNAVRAGGTAEHAGLKPGMVISDLNGVALKGMDEATRIKLLSAVGEEATFAIIGRAQLKVHKAPPPPQPPSSPLMPATPSPTETSADLARLTADD